MAVITISRGSFSHGKAVAEGLCQRLGHTNLSREVLLAQTAKDYGISEAELTQALNEPPHFWQQAQGKRLAYVKCLTAVLLDYANQGNLIYHGYVGHLLLSSIAHVLRVRVIADMDHRIQAACKRNGWKPDEAVAHIRRVDDERSHWARLVFGVDWTDPVQYHVILNIGQISVESACDTIVRMSELPEFKPTPQSVKAFEDLRLSCRVWAAIAKNPQTRSAGIQVTADGGEVVISGTIGSAKARELIPQIARQVEGVQTLRCDAGEGADWYW